MNSVRIYLTAAVLLTGNNAALTQIYRETGHADGRNDFSNTLPYSIQTVIVLPVPNILSACKAEEGGDAVASLTDDNAADGKIGGAESTITVWMKY